MPARCVGWKGCLRRAPSRTTPPPRRGGLRANTPCECSELLTPREECSASWVAERDKPNGFAGSLHIGRRMSGLVEVRASDSEECALRRAGLRANDSEKSASAACRRDLYARTNGLESVRGGACCNQREPTAVSSLAILGPASIKRPWTLLVGPLLTLIPL